MLVALMLLHIYTLLSIVLYQTIIFSFSVVEFEHLYFLPALVENKINEVSSVTSFPCERTGGVLEQDQASSWV